ncbi:MAG: hypothetical protein N3A63_09715 [Bacteroidetes bacterium]|nr:hypothetical protein [Bacteroidota bacterium]
MKEPRRSIFGVFYEMYGDQIIENKRANEILLQYFSEKEIDILLRMVKRGLNVHRTSSVGRLFDAIAAVLERRGFVRYEGQAAMELEFSATTVKSDEMYSVSYRQEESLVIIDWQTLIEDLLDDRARGVSPALCARKFHNTLVSTILSIASKLGIQRVALSGGCFQNKLLTERAVEILLRSGFQPYWHQRVPPNDGGIALGQAVAVLMDKHVS